MPLMSHNMMIGYNIYDRFTVEHFPLCQRMILTTSFFARDSISNENLKFYNLQAVLKKRSTQ
jgi:hypothetical protein